MTLRIAHVLSSFGMGGQERVVLDLARMQAEFGHHVMVVSLGALPDGPLAAEFRACGIDTETHAKSARGFDTALPFELAGRFRRLAIDIVHTHNPQALVYGALAASLGRARAIHTKHGANPDAGRRLIVRRAAATFLDAFVAVSGETEAIARKNREVAEQKLTTIPNGIKLSRFAPDAKARAEVRRELGIAPSAWLVGTVGRLSVEKAQVLLLRSVMRTLGPERQLALVGEGSERERLTAEVASFGERSRYVHFLGMRRDVPRVLAALDVFALTSVTEGLPLVVLEAMAMSLPVVATAVGGVPGVIDEGVTGLLVPSGDETRLEVALERLASNREVARTMGKRARAQALQRYDHRRMVDAYLTLYESVLSRPA